MTGPLTLKWRLLEENFGSVNLSSQKLQFLNNISNLWNFRSVTSVPQTTNYHHKRQIFQLYWCRVKRSVQKTCHRLSWVLFVTKIAKTSDQLDERKLQSSHSLSALIRMLRRFLFCAFAYKRPNSLVDSGFCSFFSIHPL